MLNRREAEPQLAIDWPLTAGVALVTNCFWQICILPPHIDFWGQWEVVDSKTEVRAAAAAWTENEEQRRKCFIEKVTVGILQGHFLLRYMSAEVKGVRGRMTATK